MSHILRRFISMSSKIIGTHNGTFHCDEALAVYLLRNTKEFSNANVTRTRDPTKLNECDIVVDVGAVYDHERLRYDHHQRGFQEVFDENHDIKLSSAGLIYKHYGKEIIARKLNLELSDSKVETFYQRIYDSFIEGIDAIDNGISRYETDLKPRYSEGTNLSARVARLNPWWNVKTNEQDMEERFNKASELTGSEFMSSLEFLSKAWLPARQVVLNGFENAKKYDKEGRIMVLESSCPWKEHLYDIEEEKNIDNKEGSNGKLLYVIFSDELGGSWRIQAVPETNGSFESRKALPESWRGLRDEELSQHCGIEGCIFVHASGFIGGNKTREGALEMAQKALS